MQVRELELVHCAKLTTYKASCSGLSARWERRKDSHWRFPFELSLSLSLSLSFVNQPAFFLYRSGSRGIVSAAATKMNYCRSEAKFMGQETFNRSE